MIQSTATNPNFQEGIQSLMSRHEEDKSIELYTVIVPLLIVLGVFCMNICMIFGVALILIMEIWSGYYVETQKIKSL